MFTLPALAIVMKEKNLEAAIILRGCNLLQTS